MKSVRITLAAIATTALAGVALVGASGTASAAARPTAINQWCGYTAAEPQIGYGSTGVAVQQAQCELDSVDNGATSLKADGIFGTETKAWAEQFQGCAGLTVDGIIGPKTWKALDSWSAVARSCG
jgi:lysozyme